MAQENAMNIISVLNIYICIILYIKKKKKVLQISPGSTGPQVLYKKPSDCNNPGYTNDVICFKDFKDTFRKAWPSVAA
jgi:hypothetical protein